MKTINRFTLVGNIGKITKVGSAVKVDIATEAVVSDRDGQRKPLTQWSTVTLFGAQAEYAQNHCKVGQIGVAEGRIENTSYERNGQTVYSTDLVANHFTNMEKPARS